MVNYSENINEKIYNLYCCKNNINYDVSLKEFELYKSKLKLIKTLKDNQKDLFCEFEKILSELENLKQRELIEFTIKNIK